MAAAFSSLLAPAHPLALLNSKGGDPATSCSCCSSSSGMMPLPLKRSRRMRRVEAAMATMTADRESVLLTSHRKESAMAAAAAAFDYEKMMEGEEGKRKKKKDVEDCVTAERLDEWIRDSIGEIVRNIGGESPFLMQIFSKGPSLLKLEREEAVPESWPLIKKAWKQDSSRVPDGVILVKQLTDNDDNDNEEEVEESTANDNSECGGSSSKKWGLLVQGRGMDCAAASCYILNTCRVRSAAGFCTHFCLVRAKCFGDSLDKQINKAWLQGR